MGELTCRKNHLQSEKSYECEKSEKFSEISG